MASRIQGGWAKFYYVLIAIGTVNVLLCCYAFRQDTSWAGRSSTRADTSRTPSSGQAAASKTALRELQATAKLKSVWLLSLFYCLSLGAVITVSGWVVEYLHIARDGDLSKVGYASAAFNGGCAFGRFALAEPTFRYGEKRMLLIYLVLSLALQIVFWEVPDFKVAMVVTSLMGMFLGPGFVTGSSVASQLVPRELQSTGLMLIFVMAQLGGAAFPAVFGVTATEVGIYILQPTVVALLAGAIVGWILVPNPKTKRVWSI